MDKALAAKMAKEIIGSEVSGWRACSLLGSGKSALVLRAEREGQVAALKIFDPALVEAHTEAVQLKRISRELSLVGKTHPHLARIFDGGKCSVTSLLFVLMEFVPAKDLAEVLTAVPRDRIRPLIAQLADAAHFLENQGLAHRDIKPSNIAVSDDFQKLTLLDLAVLRPFGETGLTDTSEQHFVGTLQYSSPEFLFRKEEDTPEGWRALAFYQIGAVLHDLIKKTRIFEEFCVPYPRLVEAVKYTTPEFDVPGADPDLVALARSCLVKDPQIRLNLLTWESFAASPPPATVPTIKDRVKKLQASLTTASTQQEIPSPNLVHALNVMLGRISTMIRDECSSNADVFPPLEVHDHPLHEADAAAFLAAFPKSSGKGVSSAFALLLRIKLLDLEAKIVEVSASAAVSGDVRRFPPEAFPTASMLYRGPFEDDVVKTRIDYALYAAIEAVFHTPAVQLDETHPLNIMTHEKV